MIKQISSRLGVAVATIVGASIFSFLLLRVMPGDPARLVAGDLADASTVAKIHASMGLNSSLPTQYWRYITSFLHGDLGFSYSSGQPVTTLIGTRLPASIELGLTAVVFAVGFAIISASVAVYRQRRGADLTLRAASSLAMGTPTFWAALVALLLLSVKLGIFPGPEGRLSPSLSPPPHVTGLYTLDALLAGQWGTMFNAAWHLILPALIIAMAPFAFLSRMFRAQLRNTLREPYITVGRSRGLTRRAVFVRHAMPNSLLGLVAATSLLFAELLTGSVLIEKIFGWPGVGALTVDAIEQKDFAVVQGVILLSAAFYVAISFLADLTYLAIDPRLRAGAK